MILSAAANPLSRTFNDRSATQVKCESIGLAAWLNALEIGVHTVVGHEQGPLSSLSSRLTRRECHFVVIDGEVPNLFPRFDVQDQRELLLFQVGLQPSPQDVGGEVISVFRAVTVAVPVAVAVGNVLSMAGGEQSFLVADSQLNAIPSAGRDGVDPTWFVLLNR